MWSDAVTVPIGMPKWKAQAGRCEGAMNEICPGNDAAESIGKRKAKMISVMMMVYGGTARLRTQRTSSHKAR